MNIIAACPAKIYGECENSCIRNTIFNNPDWFGPWIVGDFKSGNCKDRIDPKEYNHTPDKKKVQKYQQASLF